MGTIQPQGIIDLNVIARRTISEYFPEFSSCYLATEFRQVKGSLSEVHHTYPFEDNEYKWAALLFYACYGSSSVGSWLREIT